MVVATCPTQPTAAVKTVPILVMRVEIVTVSTVQITHLSKIFNGT
jgi:hypothetical protein